MNEYVWETCEELDKKIADRVRLIRKRRSISQERLSKISNVSLGSIKDLKQQDRFHCYH